MICFCTFEIPHLQYTIHIKQLKQIPAQLQSTINAYAENTNRFTATIYCKKTISPPDLAHEITHVLQWICYNRLINFVHESEHCAYLMCYMMGKAMGYAPKRSVQNRKI
jgi:hypothetical protein